jgi:hypothetical protein
MAVVQAAIAARLASRGNGDAEDRLLAIDEAADVLHVEVDWLRHHGDLPFVVRVSPGQVRYSARGLQRYIAARMRR